MLLKTSFREIKTSLGRYLAIIAIIALGVGLFSGLRVTRTAMIKTADDYLKELNMFDYRLISTLGWTEDDAKAFSELDGVDAAEGAISQDLLHTTENGSDIVLKAHSITENVNKLALVAGRMPEQANECVADEWSFDESSIGTKIRLSDNNTQDTLDNFAYSEYTIVGIVTSPIYINYERGGTSLGNGSVSAFIYMPREGFNIDYFTEIDVTLTEGGKIYSDEYKNAVDSMEDTLTEFAEERADIRYNDIVSEAQTELDDAKQTLAESEQELADGWDKYYEGLDEYNSGLEQYNTGVEEYETQASEARNSYTSAVNTVESELSEAKAQLEASKTELDSAKAQLDSAKAQIDENQKTLESGYAEYDKGKAEYDQGCDAYISGLYQYENAVKQLCQAYGITDEMARYQLSDVSNELNQTCQQLSDAKQTLEQTKAQLDAGQTELDAAIEQYNEGLEKYNEGLAQYEDGLAQYEASAQQARNSYRSAIANAESQIEQARETLDSSKQELDDAKITLDDSLKDLNDGQDEINDGKADIAEAEQKIADIKTPSTYVLNRDTNVGYVCFESDTNIVAGVSKVFPLFFFLLAALVCITTMTRMVEDQRTQLGVLMAMGYGNGAIIFKYFFYSGSASIIGCAIGFFGGSFIFPRILWHAYNIMYGFNVGIKFVLDWELALSSFTMYLVCALGATYLVCRNFLREVPANLIRPKSPKAGKRVLLERVGFIWKHLSFLAKVSVRNIFRYRQRFFMMILGIGGCTALLITGFGIKDSIANVVDYQFEEVTLYDCTVSFTDAVDESAQEKFMEECSDISGAVFLHDGSVTAETDDSSKTVSLLVTDDSLDGFMDLHSGETQLNTPNDGDVLINTALADVLNLEIGDSLILRDSEMNALNVTVSGIFDNYVSNYAIINSETCQNQWGYVPDFKTAFVNVSDKSSEGVHAASAEMLDMDNVSAVSVNLDLRERVANMMSVLDYIVLMVTGCAGALAFIVLYNLTNINITERIREIATIKVLGFYPGETASYVFRENNALTFMGMIVGLPLGKWLHAYVMSQIKIDTISFDVRISALSILYSLVLTIVFAAVVNFFMYFRLRNIDMAESLKSIE